MKTAYRILVTALGVAALAWFLPWLVGVLFPTAQKDPFVAYSPICNSFIISENNDDNLNIYAIDTDGSIIADGFTKNGRDSLLPQVYFNQLNARGELPDTIAGHEISVPILKHGQWTFSSLPRDINRVDPGVYMIMESMPSRFELEDPDEVFRFADDIEFIDIATNEVNPRRSAKFSKVLADRGFVYPPRALHANITARKQYDEGYLIADANGNLFQMKMNGSNPFVVKVNKPDSIKIAHVFILENIDTRQLGLVTDTANRLYALEKADYSLHLLPVGTFDPTRERLSIYKTIFNWVLKIRDDNSSRWIALDSDDYSLLGEYSLQYEQSAVGRIASYIFPFEISFTSVDDQYAAPRIEEISAKALILNLILAIFVTVVALRRKVSKRETALMSLLTIPFGIYLTITYLLIK